MQDFSIGASIALVLRTYPFLLLRCAVYFGIAAAFVVVVDWGAAIGLGIGTLAGPPGRLPGLFWGAVGGFAFLALILWWLREYFLYLIEAGHAAAMALAVEGKVRPPAFGQIGQAITALQRCFPEIPILFSIDRLVNGVLETFPEVPSERGVTLPRPADLAWRFALGPLRDTILARPTASSARNVWAEIRDSLILFAQNHRHLMGNAILLAALGYGISLLAFLVALVPAAALAANYANASVPIAVLLAAVFAWSFKQALVEPLLIASMLQVYARATKDQEPDPAWDLKLTEASGQFREIKARAVPFVRNPRRSFTV